MAHWIVTHRCARGDIVAPDVCRDVGRLFGGVDPFEFVDALAMCREHHLPAIKFPECARGVAGFRNDDDLSRT